VKGSEVGGTGLGGSVMMTAGDGVGVVNSIGVVDSIGVVVSTGVVDSTGAEDSTGVSVGFSDVIVEDSMDAVVVG